MNARPTNFYSVDGVAQEIDAAVEEYRGFGAGSGPKWFCSVGALKAQLSA
jgi:hypothetical protein